MVRRASALGFARVALAGQNDLGLALALLGRADEAIAVERAVIDAAALLGDSHRGASARLYLSLAQAAAGDAAGAMVSAGEALAALAKQPGARVMALAIRARAALACGDVAGALGDTGEAMRVLGAVGQVEEGEAIAPTCAGGGAGRERRTRRGRGGARRGARAVDGAGAKDPDVGGAAAVSGGRNRARADDGDEALRAGNGLRCVDTGGGWMRCSRAMKHIGLGLWMTVLVSACGSGESAPDAGTPALPTGPVTAVTEAGPVTGRAQGGVAVFRRVSYAAPPVGALRFAAPAAVAPWTTARDATVAGSECTRSGSLFGGPAPGGEEDCLHVNVFTRGLSGARPVMVWIHGGGFLTGSGSDVPYDGTRLAAEHDVVVVTLNYRLGCSGFSRRPALPTASAGSGNWGFLDQQAALRWVRANAAHFGGDPARVTIFGESAGATSVLLHTVAPGSRGLFARAIVESSPAPRLPDRARADGFGIAVATAVGCTAGDVAGCLRAAAPVALYNALRSSGEAGGPFFRERGFFYLPTLDGVTFTEQATVRDVSRGAGGGGAHGARRRRRRRELVHGRIARPGGAVRGGLSRGDRARRARGGDDPGAGRQHRGAVPAVALRVGQRRPHGRDDRGFVCATRYVARLQRAAGRPVWL